MLDFANLTVLDELEIAKGLLVRANRTIQSDGLIRAIRQISWEQEYQQEKQRKKETR